MKCHAVTLATRKMNAHKYIKQYWKMFETFIASINAEVSGQIGCQRRKYLSTLRHKLEFATNLITSIVWQQQIPHIKCCEWWITVVTLCTGDYFWLTQRTLTNKLNNMFVFDLLQSKSNMYAIFCRYFHLPKYIVSQILDLSIWGICVTNFCTE